MTEELNCSEGARMLIERMQTHPKDFKGNGRFAHITDQILGNVPTGYSQLSDRDDDALTAAYEKYIMEPALTEYVVDEIFNGEKRREEEQKAYVQTSSTYTANLARSMANTKNQMSTGLLVGSGFSDPRNTYGNAINNPAQGQVVWTEETGLQEKKSPSIFDEMRRKLKRNKSK
jgi:hypothetical protein